MGAVTNDHQLSDLKQQKCISSQFWRPEAHRFHWAGIKVWVGPPSEARGEDPHLASRSFW